MGGRTYANVYVFHRMPGGVPTTLTKRYRPQTAHVRPALSSGTRAKLRLNVYEIDGTTPSITVHGAI